MSGLTVIIRRALKKPFDWRNNLDFSGNYRELNYEDLVFLQKIGEGAFGIVYRGQWRNAEVAIKVLHANLDVEQVEVFRHEAELMHRLGNHPNIVAFVGAVSQGDHFCLVTEFCERGSLSSLLEREELSMDRARSFALEIALGIAYLHEEGVIHRDIAARNVLISSDDHVRISDFGTARVCDSEKENTTKSNIGPVRWMAPESLSSRVYSQATDAWMYGVLLWEMTTRAIPFGDMNVLDIAFKVLHGGYLEVPPDADPLFAALMRGLFVENPDKRFTISRCISLLRSEMQLDDLLSVAPSFNETSRNLQSDYVIPGTVPENEYTIPSELRSAAAAERRAAERRTLQESYSAAKLAAAAAKAEAKRLKSLLAEMEDDDNLSQ